MNSPSSPEYLPAIELEPQGTAERAIIWLHGLGADGYDFVPLVPELDLPATLGVRFVFPHAPGIPVTLNGGMVMPAWYDIRGTDLKAGQDLEGLRESAGRIRSLIEREEARGIPCSRIVLAGFSQGGAVALHTGLRLDRPLAGILALSTYVVGEDLLAGERHPANAGTPVFQAHGQYDPMVPIARGEAARDLLVSLGHTVTWRTYPMMHAVCPEETRDIGDWLRSVLDPGEKRKGEPN